MSATTHMADAYSDRLAGSALMVGSVATLVFNLLHPRAAPTRATETQLRLATETSYWIVIAYGLAVVASGALPRWLGTSAVTIGVLGVVDGAAMAFDFEAFVWFNLVFSAVSLLFTLWTFAAGVVIRRRAGTLVS